MLVWGIGQLVHIKFVETVLDYDADLVSTSVPTTTFNVAVLELSTGLSYFFPLSVSFYLFTTLVILRSSDKADLVINGFSC